MLSTVTYFLNAHPRTKRRLTHEVRRAFRRSADIDGRTTAGLPYLDAVIAEGLRMLPPAAFGLPRTSPGATVDGHFVPAGTTVHAQPWVLAHDARRWRNPYDWAPERWLPDGGYDDDREGFRPFSDGLRGCLGKNLAMLEMRVVLAKVVWHFDMEMERGREGWVEGCRLYTVLAEAAGEGQVPARRWRRERYRSLSIFDSAIDDCAK